MSIKHELDQNVKYFEDFFNKAEFKGFVTKVDGSIDKRKPKVIRIELSLSWDCYHINIVIYTTYKNICKPVKDSDGKEPTIPLSSTLVINTACHDVIFYNIGTHSLDKSHKYVERVFTDAAKFIINNDNNKYCDFDGDCFTAIKLD